MPYPQESVSAGAYEIHIGDTAPARLDEYLRLHKFSSIFVLVDEHTFAHCLPPLAAQIKLLSSAEIIEIESGERNKSLEVCAHIWRAFGELGADRHSLLINLGGGVITDMGGFVAAVYKRGMAFIHVPTTLLAQVDASIGGKTGVDLDGLKNQLGVFRDPRALYIYPPFLKTLPRRDMLSGFAEIVKHAIIADAEYWEQIQHINLADDTHWEMLIRKSIDIKLSIVTSDPEEKGARKLLNFGHTIGHAIETHFLERAETTLLHGEAVAAGMIAEAYLSHKLAGLPAQQLENLTSFILRIFDPVVLDPIADHRLLELMRHDKKNEKGRINFTLLNAIGKAVFDRFADAALVREALRYYRESLAIAKASS